MFAVSFINSNHEVDLKCGFKSDDEAYKWIDQQGNKITKLKLLVWSEAIQAYRTLENFMGRERFSSTVHIFTD